MTKGFGLGFRPPIYHQVTEQKDPRIDWFEIVSENFMGVGGRPRRFLEKLTDLYPIAMHGVGLSIAGPDPLSQTYLKRLKELEQRVAPVLVTDHLCWTSRTRKQSFDLLPFPFTEGMLAYVAARVKTVQNYLGRQLLLENPSAYIHYQESTMGEAEFLSRLVELTGCGLLLDVNNLVVNRKNLGIDPYDYMEQLPPGVVQQFHLAGHEVNPDVVIDTHDHPVEEETWQVYGKATAKWPQAAVLVEWDDKIPPLSGLVEQLDLARQHHSDPDQACLQTGPYRKLGETTPSVLDESHHQSLGDLWQTLTTGQGSPKLTPSTPTNPKRGCLVYSNGYRGRLLETLASALTTFTYIVEEDTLEILMDQFLKEHGGFEVESLNDLATPFVAFLKNSKPVVDFGVPAALVIALAEFDGARAEAYMAPEPVGPRLKPENLAKLTAEQWPTLCFELVPAVRLHRFACDPDPIYQAVERDEVPDPPEVEQTPYIFSRTDAGVTWRRCEDEELRLLQWMGGQPNGCSFAALCEQVGDINSAVQRLVEWSAAGMISRCSGSL